MIISRRKRNLLGKIIFLGVVTWTLVILVTRRSAHQIDNIHADIHADLLQQKQSQQDNDNVIVVNKDDLGDQVDEEAPRDDQVKVEDEFREKKVEPKVENKISPYPVDKYPGKKNDEEQVQEIIEAEVIQPPIDHEGPGEMGKGVKLGSVDADTKAKIDKGWKDNAFNQYYSDLISLDRTLPDFRDPWCKNPNRYLPVSSLPSTSVIICFHNEAWSTLLRTVHSVINRSPPELIKEVLLVDDASTQDHLKEQLENYITRFGGKVKVVRAKERTGLIRARLLGAEHAVGEVLTYLDSHCECSHGWLEPLLDRIARNSTNVVCPNIDVISDSTLEYLKPSYIAVGGFDWNLIFNWHAIPAREKERREHHAAPVHSPTMAGGLFAINKKFFEKLGLYDSGFDIWGGENLELSFKTWMCGGTLEIIPCSHVGHIFRKRSPYKWRDGVNVVKRNSVRLAEVWLDEYKHNYYDRIGHDLGDFGDVSSRIELRNSLQCKSFGWYLENVYPELFIPSESIAHGELRSLYRTNESPTSMCVDSPAKKANLHKPVGLYPCHKQGGNQYWLYSKTGEIRRDEFCLDNSGGTIVLYNCHGSRGNQEWLIEDWGGIKNPGSGKCMTMTETKDKLLAEPCDKTQLRQKWLFENYDKSQDPAYKAA